MSLLFESHGIKAPNEDVINRIKENFKKYKTSEDRDLELVITYEAAVKVEIFPFNTTRQNVVFILKNGERSVIAKYEDFEELLITEKAKTEIDREWDEFVKRNENATDGEHVLVYEAIQEGEKIALECVRTNYRVLRVLSVQSGGYSKFLKIVKKADAVVEIRAINEQIEDNEQILQCYKTGSLAPIITSDNYLILMQRSDYYGFYSSPSGFLQPINAGAASYFCYQAQAFYELAEELLVSEHQFENARGALSRHLVSLHKESQPQGSRKKLEETLKEIFEIYGKYSGVEIDIERSLKHSACSIRRNLEKESIGTIEFTQCVYLRNCTKENFISKFLKRSYQQFRVWTVDNAEENKIDESDFMLSLSNRAKDAHEHTGNIFAIKIDDEVRPQSVFELIGSIAGSMLTAPAVAAVFSDIKLENETLQHSVLPSMTITYLESGTGQQLA